MNYKEIEEKLKEQVFQMELSEMLIWLAAEYSFISGQLEDIVVIKGKKWLSDRLHSKTDKEADRKWQASEMGVNYEVYRLQLKKIEKMIGAIRKRIEVLEKEREYSRI